MSNLHNKIYEAINTGIQKALILDPYNDVSVKWKEKEISNEFIPYELKTVNMGTDVLWCEYNLGATPGNDADDWHGNRYAWGETEVKTDYNWDNYKFCSNEKLTKYNNELSYGKADYKICLDKKDDAANKLYQQLSIPSKDDYQKLLENSRQAWIANYQGITGLDGILLTSLINGNTLFFPEIKSSGVTTRLWTSSLYDEDPDYAYSLMFNKNKKMVIYHFDRAIGLPIRPIMKKC